MSFRTLIKKSTFRVLRKTHIILASQAITTTVTGYSQPSRAACIKVIVASGTTGSGTVTINGTVSGVADFENLVFTVNGRKETTKEFTVISLITTSGFTDEAETATVELHTITLTGQKIVNEVEIFASMYGWMDYKRGGIKVITPGMEEEVYAKLFCLYSSTIPIQKADIIIDEYGDRFEVLFPEKVSSRKQKVHHLELRLKLVK